MKKVLVCILFLFINSTIFSQNFFPIEKWVRYCYKVNYNTSGPMGHNSTGSYNVNCFSIPKIIVNGKEFYTIKFNSHTYSLRYDQSLQKLFVYPPGYSNEFLAFNFNLPVNAVDSTYITGVKRAYSISKKDSIDLWGKKRLQITFSIDDWKARNMSFVEDIGIYYHYYSYGGEYPQIYKANLFSLIYDTLQYNPRTVKLDSTDSISDRYIDMFPFVLRVYGSISDTSFIKIFKSEFFVIRQDTVFLARSFDVDKKTWKSNIGIFQNELQPDDIIKYRITYSDSSIFLITKALPDTGYFSFRILELPNGVEANTLPDKKFRLDNPYPNPFNPATNINFSIPGPGYVTLELYNILGEKVALLINDFKEAGDYSFSLSRSLVNTASGVFFCRLKYGNQVETRKVVLIQ